MKSHVRAIPVSAEDYLRKDMSKANITQTDDKLNEFVDHFVERYKYEELHDMKMEEKDVVPKTMQPMRLGQIIKELERLCYY